MPNFSNSKFIVIIAIAIALPTVAQADNVPPRYELVPATVTISGKPVACLFRVEKTTGQTWVYGVTTLPVAAQGGTNVIRMDFPSWTPISEDLSASYAQTVTNLQPEKVTSKPTQTEKRP